MLVAVGGVVALIVALAVIGLFVDRRHIASVRATLRQTPDVVWGVIADHESAPEWRAGLKRVERLPDRAGSPSWVEVGRHGRLPFAVTVSERPRRYATQILGD